MIERPGEAETSPQARFSARPASFQASGKVERVEPSTSLYSFPRRPIFRSEILTPFKRLQADSALRSCPCYQAERRRISIRRRAPSTARRRDLGRDRQGVVEGKRV